MLIDAPSVIHKVRQNSLHAPCVVLTMRALPITITARMADEFKKKDEEAEDLDESIEEGDDTDDDVEDEVDADDAI